MSTNDNPFVASALAVLRQHNGKLPLGRLAAKLAILEPRLSPFNLECAAREAKRVAPEVFAVEKAAAEAEKAAAEAVEKAKASGEYIELRVVP
jgi:hypothetical protein